MKYKKYNSRAFEIKSGMTCVIHHDHICIWLFRPRRILKGTEILEIPNIPNILKILKQELSTTEYFEFQKDLFERV